MGELFFIPRPPSMQSASSLFPPRSEERSLPFSMLGNKRQLPFPVEEQQNKISKSTLNPMVNLPSPTSLFFSSASTTQGASGHMDTARRVVASDESEGADALLYLSSRAIIFPS